MPSSGRIVHSTTMQLSAVSVQLHPSMSVVCKAARVSVSTDEGSLLRLTAATPKSTFTGCCHSWVACTDCRVVPTYTAVGPSVTAYRLSVSPTWMLLFESANSSPLAKLRVFLIQYQGRGSNTKDNIVSFKIQDVLYNAGQYYSSDGSYTNIFAGVLDQATQTNVYFTGMGSLERIPQAINTITILATDSLTNINSGVDDTL